MAVEETTEIVTLEAEGVAPEKAEEMAAEETAEV